MRIRSFTLVETLVVIGVIAVLLALLLPVISRARLAVRRTECASNQRQTYVALQQILQTRGRLPLAGEVILSSTTRGYPSLPYALNDVERTRYSYGRVAGVPTGEDVLPILMVVANHVAKRQDDYFSDFRGTAALRRFLFCPAETPELREVEFWHELIIDDVRYSSAVDGFRASYAVNGALCGFDHALAFDRRHLRGNVSQVRDASRIFLLADGLGSARFIGARNVAGPTSLADALASGSALAFNHRGATNITFLDGHVEPVRRDDRGRLGRIAVAE